MAKIAKLNFFPSAPNLIFFPLRQVIILIIILINPFNCQIGQLSKKKLFLVKVINGRRLLFYRSYFLLKFIENLLVAPN